MPRLYDYDWRLDDNKKLTWQPIPGVDDHDDAAFHQEILSLLVPFYNRYNKVAAFGDSSPPVQFAERADFLSVLMSMAGKDFYLASLEKGMDQLMIDVFWHARVFNVSGSPRLIPMLEFVDHHIFAGGFTWKKMASNQRALTLKHQAIGRKKNVYARYEIMDNLKAYVDYGFVDDTTFFIQSLPFKMELSSSIAMDVQSQAVLLSQSGMDDWLNQPLYANSVMYRSKEGYANNTLSLPYLLLPPKRHELAFDDALLDQLRQVETIAALSDGDLANENTTGAIKRKLWEVNRDAYRELQESAKLASLPPSSEATIMLKKLLKHQKAILAEFAQCLA